MSLNNPFATTPFLAQWLSLAETTTGAWRNAFGGDVARQGAAMMFDFHRRMLGAWTATWAPSARAVPVEAPAPASTALVAVQPAPVPAVVAEVAAVPQEAEKPRRAGKPKAQPLITASRGRKSAPAITAKLPRGKRVTRH